MAFCWGQCWHKNAVLWELRLQQLYKYEQTNMMFYSHLFIQLMTFHWCWCKQGKHHGSTHARHAGLTAFLHGMTSVTWHDMTSVTWHDMTWPVWHDMTSVTWHDQCDMTWPVWHDLTSVTWHDQCDMTWPVWHDMTSMTWHDQCNMIFMHSHLSFVQFPLIIYFANITVWPFTLLIKTKLRYIFQLHHAEHAHGRSFIISLTKIIDSVTVWWDICDYHMKRTRQSHLISTYMYSIWKLTLIEQDTNIPRFYTYRSTHFTA